MAPDAVAAGMYIGLLLGALHVAVHGTARVFVLRIALAVLIVYLVLLAEWAIRPSQPPPLLGIWGFFALTAPWGSWITIGPELNIFALCALIAWLWKKGATQPRTWLLDLTPAGRSFVYFATVCLAALSVLLWTWDRLLDMSPLDALHVLLPIAIELPNPYAWAPSAIGLPLLVVVGLLVLRRLWIVIGPEPSLPASYGGFSLLLCEAALVFWVVALLVGFSLPGPRVFHSEYAYAWAYFPAAFLPLVAVLVVELRSFGKPAASPARSSS